ncbi:substrate-binding domain-containing protein [Geminisphaera colitermitum]|uniref:substrate-binding domain-containing protein n=1 Tax=Geminisphaera colitermitum TaxID=1148786 RepID=UPI000158CAA0|nr:GntR family transcriptional regulator [Geminisphaera colitermitum]
MSSVAAALPSMNPAPLRPSGKVETIHAELRKEVIDGVWKAGDRLPNEAELAARFACSSGTINKAVALMVHEGLVERRTRTGTRVVCNNPAPDASFANGTGTANGNLFSNTDNAPASATKTGNIGMVFAENSPSWSNHPLIASYMLGVEEGCQGTGFHALMELPVNPAEVPGCVRERKVDGLLIKAARGAPAFLKHLPPELPVVLLALNNPAVPFPQVASDNHGAGWVMTEHLWNNGHRRIAFLCTDARNPIFINRLQGYESCLRQQSAYDPALVDMTEKPEATINEPERTSPDMGSALDRLLALPPSQRPTAILTANDWMARGLYTALAARGLRVGDDISVAGFDNMELLCESLTPQLTSFDVGLTVVASEATRHLLNLIATPATARRPITSIHLVRGRLVERQSVCLV